MSTSSGNGVEDELPAAVPLSHLNRAKALLRSLGKRPLKRLGQHFLVDNSILGKIIQAGQLSSDDTVIEVGPGLGILTEELAKRAGRVITVEFDPVLVAFLRETLAAHRNVTVVQADILKTDPADLLKQVQMTLKTGPWPEPYGEEIHTPYKVIANLPYNIASPVLRRFLEARVKPGLLVVMVQREVARRMAAQPGEMSPLSVGVQLYGRPSIVHVVSPRSFYPPPKVHSAIVRIEVYPHPAVDVPPEDLFRAVRAGFNQPRKQLRNTISSGLGLPPATAVALLTRAGVNPERRPQTLSLDEWAKIAVALREKHPTPIQAGPGGTEP